MKLFKLLITIAQKFWAIVIINKKLLISIITPLTTIARKTWTIVAIVELVLALIIWQFSGGGLIPGPIKVFAALIELFNDPDFISSLVTSTTLTVKGMGISIIIALFISYLSVIPLFNPIAKFIVKCRYLTLTGLIFLFTLLTKNGSDLKISLLLFGIVPFFVTSLLSIIANISQQEYDLCTTLRYKRWETVCEVIIVGRFDQIFEVMKQNFAIAWIMITMVEGLSMSEGGLGVMLIKANKYINLPKVFALLLVVFINGIAYDFLFGLVRKWLFPYSNLNTKRGV